MRVRPLLLPFMALTLAVASACTSIEERFEKAEAFEAQGRYEQAAYGYIDILQREPTNGAARNRLREVAPRAIEDRFLDAQEHQRVREYESGLGALNQAQRLANACAAVGVRLSLPEGAPQLAADLTEQTIEAYRNGAERHALAGRFGAAIQSYEKAGSYLDASDPRTREFAHRAGELHLDWAQADLENAAYRSAYDRAQLAVEVAGADEDLASRAFEIQEDALYEGTRPVAFLPLANAYSAIDERAERMSEDLDEVLTYRKWAQPVPFVGPLDPVSVSREARRAGHPRVRLEAWDGAEVGRALGADFVVMTEFLDLTQVDRNVSERRRPVRFKRGRRGPVVRDTAYVEQTRTVVFDAAVQYRIVDADTRRILVERTVEARTEGRIEQAVFAGDYRELELSQGARRLFEESPYLVEQELLDALVDRLSEQLASDVYASVLVSIP